MAVVSFEQMLDFVLDEAVRVAFDEAARVGLSVCEGCLSRWLARRMVLNVIPILHADYRREQLLTMEQVRALVEEAGRSAVHVRC
jgi:hypothetical protein